MPYRDTGMGGLYYAIAVCQLCRSVLEPVNVVRSRTGNHGEDLYEHEHPLVFLVLYRSNTGRRRSWVEGEELFDETVRAIIARARYQWEWYGVATHTIRENVEVDLRAAGGE
jgi:hypothetical protein